jgi:ABC-type lipoprotein release transport system permease subunit
MTVQFNLLPDVKLEYMRSKRIQGLVITISTIVAAASIAILVLLYIYVVIVQKNHINNLSAQITSNTEQISSNTNLNKILTIQNQLESLPALDNAKPATIQILPYINQLTPASATISNVTVDLIKDTVSIQGNADSISTVNTFVDTLKFTNYTIGKNKETNAFSNVVLSAFAENTSSSGVSYTITLSFDPLIFSGTEQATLVVPQIITTRSITQQPTDLFLGKTTGTN